MDLDQLKQILDLVREHEHWQSSKSNRAASG